MEDEDFLDDIGAEEMTAQEPEVVEQPAAVVEEVQPVVEVVAEVIPEPKPEPQHVPITALLDERDKRKGLEQELERLRAAQQPAQAPAVPDMFEDPDGFAAYQDQKVQAALYSQNLAFSERMAKKEYGTEVFEQAKAWAYARCDADPMFNAKVAASPDPYEFAISEWKREQIVSKVSPDDFAQFEAWKAAQSQLQEQTKPVPIVPPRSLASAPSAGGILTEVAPTDDEIFEDTFSRK